MVHKFISEKDRFGGWMVVEIRGTVRSLCTFCNPQTKEDAEKWVVILNRHYKLGA